MFAPGAEALAAEFHISNTTIEAFTVSIYVLGFALGPLVLAPLSELYGRLGIYYFCNIVYFAFTLGCALSTDTAMFLVFRFLCGCSASGPMSVGGGTVADVTSQSERGKAMALFAVGPLLGPVSIFFLNPKSGLRAISNSDIAGRSLGPSLEALFQRTSAGVGPSGSF